MRLLRVLIIEDSEDDCLFIRRHLMQAGYELEFGRVDTAEGLAEALEAQTWELVLSDYMMPTFDAMRAFAQVRAHSPQLPFIIVSGRVGEERAVQALKVGIADYVPKDNLARLVPAVERELRDAAILRERNTLKEQVDRLRAEVRQIEADVEQRSETLQAVQRELDVVKAEREDVQRKFERSDTRYQDLVEGSLQGIFVVQDTFTPVFCNMAFARMHGLNSPEEVLALGSTRPLIAEREHERIAAFANRRVRGESLPSTYEYEARTIQGRSIWLSCSVRMTTWNGQQAAQITVIDITQQRRALEVVSRQAATLRQSEGRNRALFDSMPHALIIANGDGIISEVNPQTIELFGYAQADLVGNSIDQLLPEHGISEQIQSYRFGEDSSGPTVVKPGGEHMAVRKDGSKFPADVSVNAIAQLATREFIFAISDSSERRALEARIALSQRLGAVGQLAGGIAHDFNNMLAVILSYTENILDMPVLDEELRQDVVQIQGAAERSADLTRRLLVFSRRQPMQFSQVDINRVILGIKSMATRLLGEDITLTLRLAASPLPIHGDESQLEQAVLNLAINARDAMETGGDLIIETTKVELDQPQPGYSQEIKPGNYVRLSVSDSGTGMDAETQAQIFEPFFTTKGVGEGTGLGLSTVFGIVSEMNGSISVESMLGRGTTINVWFPQTRRTMPIPAREGPSVASPVARGRILLVEDEFHVRKAAHAILASAGHEVLTAANGTEALEIAKKHMGKIDLVLTDVIMPGMTGIVLAERLPDEAGLNCPVLLMTGYSKELLDRHGIVREGVQVLYKPFTKTSLLRKVNDTMAIHAG